MKTQFLKKMIHMKKLEVQQEMIQAKHLIILQFQNQSLIKFQIQGLILYFKRIKLIKTKCILT